MSPCSIINTTVVITVRFPTVMLPRGPTSHMNMTEEKQVKAKRPLQSSKRWMDTARHLIHVPSLAATKHFMDFKVLYGLEEHL